MLAARENTASLFLKPAPLLNPLAAGLGRRLVPSTDEEEEVRMTIENQGKKKSFNIFQDAPEESPGLSRVPSLQSTTDKTQAELKAF